MGQAEQATRPRPGRVLKSLSHSGHVLPLAAAGAEELARTQESILVAAQVVDEAGLDASTRSTTCSTISRPTFPTTTLPTTTRGAW